MAQSLPIVVGKAYAMHTTYVGTYIRYVLHSAAYLYIYAAYLHL